MTLYLWELEYKVKKDAIRTRPFSSYVVHIKGYSPYNICLETLDGCRMEKDWQYEGQNEQTPNSFLVNHGG